MVQGRSLASRLSEKLQLLLHREMRAGRGGDEYAGQLRSDLTLLGRELEDEERARLSERSAALPFLDPDPPDLPLRERESAPSDIAVH